MALLKLVFVTGNKHKVSDFGYILGQAIDLECVDLDLPELQGTVEDIAKDKCRRAADALGKAVMVEDVSLVFNALGTMPGPYIKWFFLELGAEGLHKLLAGFDDKTAKVISTVAYSEGPGREPVLFQEVTHGKIVPSRGWNVVGWHSVFELPNGRTFAEMTIEERMKIGSRRRVAEKLQAYLLHGTDTTLKLA